MKPLLIFFLIYLNLLTKNLNAENYVTNWFVISEFGTQISGIKKEDFIKSNISPLFLFEIGRKINNDMSIKIGYRGPYYNLIVDEKKYYYDFFFIKRSININRYLKMRKNSDEIYFDLGCGMFKNKSRNNTNFQAITSFTKEFKINNYFLFSFGLSAVIGWDIYQGNEDVLPAVSFGFKYKINY